MSYLDGVDVVDKDDELSLLLFDQGGDGVDALPDHVHLDEGPSLAVGAGLKALTQPLLLVELVLRSVGGGRSPVV